MKYIILLLIGLTIVTTSGLDKRDNTNQANKNIESSVVEAHSEPEKPKETNIPPEAKEPRKWEELSLEEKIKANPNNCDLSAQVMYEDGTCHAKTVSPTNTASTKLVGSGSCEDAIRRIFPASEHARAIKVMLQESSGNPANHNYNPATGDDSYGCFQVNLYGNNKYSRPPASELVKADVNVAYSYNLWKSVGWCSTGGWLNTSKKVGIC